MKHILSFIICSMALVHTLEVASSARIPHQTTQHVTRKKPKKETQPVETQSENTQNTAQQVVKPSQDEDEREVAIVLSNFAQIVGHFINIVKDPHTTSTVSQGVGGIICNIGNIIAQAIRAKLLLADSDMNVEEYIATLSTRLANLQTALDEK